MAKTDAKGNGAPASKKILGSEELKAKFTAKVPDEKTKQLVNLLSSRIHESRSRNFRDAYLHASVEEGVDAPFRQVNPAVLTRIIKEARTQKETGQVAKAEELARLWNVPIDDVISACPTADNKNHRVLRDDRFYRIEVPAVKSYTSIRWAALFNERNNSDLFRYLPTLLTEVNRMVCEVVSDQTRQMAAHYGYAEVLRQVILQQLVYTAPVLVFPYEKWHCDMQEDENGEEYCRKEGLRYVIPHPSQIGWDLTHPLDTFNSDTGCSWACHWKLARWGDVRQNELFWNQDKVSHGTNWFDPSLTNGFFSELYPCVLEPPTFNGPASRNLRERDVSLYTTAEDDAAVFLTNIFCRLKPAEWGLGTSKYDRWWRFVMASDDTVVGAEDLAYAPVLYCGYDPDQNKAKNASFALECIPWQAKLGNIVSQALLAMRQNALKIIPYDKDQLTEAELDDIEQQTRAAAGLIWWPFSARMKRGVQEDIGKMFFPVSFPNQNVAEMVNMLSTILTIMERVLQMSAQEVGAPATHIQTKAETELIAQNTNNRRDLTGSCVDNFIDAWKRQLYDAQQAYKDAEFVSQVTGASKEAMAALKKLGFELGETYDGKTQVSGKKSMLSIESFVSSRENGTRINQPDVARVIFGYLQQATPIMLQSITDPETKHSALKQLFLVMNRAARMAGVPNDDFLTLPPMPDKDEQEPQIEDAREYLNYNYKDLPFDVQQVALQKIGLPPTRLPPPQEQEAQGQANGLEQLLAGAVPQIQAGAVQEVGQQMQPLIDEVATIKQQLVQQQQINEQQQQQIVQAQMVISRFAQMLEPPPVAPMPNPAEVAPVEPPQVPPQVPV